MRHAAAAAVVRRRTRWPRKSVTDMDPAKRAEFQAKLDALNVKYPLPARANVKDLVNHIDYAVKLIGIDHVGISSDFDGGGGIDGYNCTSEAINVTIELVRRGTPRSRF